MKKHLLFIFILTSYFISWGQNKKLDSLWSVYNNKSEVDSNRLSALSDIAWSYNSNNPDTTILLAEQLIKLANKFLYTNENKWVARAYNTIGFAYTNKSDYLKALDYQLKALKINEVIHDKKGIKACYINMGVVYWYQANYPKALDYYLKALKIAEQLGDKNGMGGCYANIGTIYLNAVNYSKGLEYSLKALKIYEELNDKQSIGICLNNIGLAYFYENDYTKALAYYIKSLRIREEIDDKQGIGVSLNNIGNLYDKQKNYVKALEYDLKSLRIKKEIDDKPGIGVSYINIGVFYQKLANYKLATLYCDSAIRIATAIHDINDERLAYDVLASVYSEAGKYKEAYETHVKFKKLTDSIFNEDNSKQLGDLKTQFEVEKKEAELKIKSDAEHEKLKAVAAEETKRQQIIIASVVGVLLVVLVFSLFLYKRFKITQRQKAVIEKQKILVDKAYDELNEKNKEVMDSIRYAKRIQTALITSEKYVESSLNKLMKNK